MFRFRDESLRRAVRELEDRLDTVERQSRKLDAEFSDLLDRVNRQVARLVKREERATSPAETRTDGPPYQHTPPGPHALAIERARKAGLL